MYKHNSYDQRNLKELKTERPTGRKWSESDAVWMICLAKSEGEKSDCRVKSLERKWSHNRVSGGTMYEHDSIEHFLPAKTVRHISLSMESEARVPSVPCSRAVSQNFIHESLFATSSTWHREGWPMAFPSVLTQSALRNCFFKSSTELIICENFFCEFSTQYLI